MKTVAVFMLICAAASLSHADTVKKTTVGCPDKAVVAEASDAFAKEREIGFVPYVQQRCILVLKGRRVEILEKEPGTFKAIYNSPDGDLTLWIAEEAF